MKRIEINCGKVKGMEQAILDSGFKILMNPNHPTNIHIEADSVDMEKLKSVLVMAGKADYQELVDGRRSIKSVPVTPMMMVNIAKREVSSNKKIILFAVTAVATAGALVCLLF